MKLPMKWGNVELWDVDGRGSECERGSASVLREIFVDAAENRGRYDRRRSGGDAGDVVRMRAEPVDVEESNDYRAMCTPETQEQRKKRIMRTVVGVGLLGAGMEGRKGELCVVAASAVILFRDRFKWK